MQNRKTVLVCVAARKSSQGLVKAGRDIARKLGACLEVVSVLPVADGVSAEDCDTLESIYRTAKRYGGGTAVYFSDDPILVAAAHIAKRRPLTVVAGFPGENSINFVYAIHLMLPEIPVTLVDGEGQIYNMLSAQGHTLPAGLR